MLLNILNNLTSDQLDQGNEHFQPSNLEITSVDVGNKATNVIPQSASARFNIRYNDNFNSETIEDEINRRLENFKNGQYKKKIYKKNINRYYWNSCT